jgi:acyl-CoA thioesterase-1
MAQTMNDSRGERKGDRLRSQARRAYILPMLTTRRPLLLALALLAACGGGGGSSSDAALLSPEALSRPAEIASSARVPLEVPGDAPLVVFLGDSIAAGLHLDPDDAFPALLQRTLAAEGHPFRLVNAGVSGDTSAGGLRRIDWILRQEPDVLVLELGGNDGLRGQRVKDIEQRLRTIVERAQEAGTRVLLLGVRLPPSLGRAYVREFEALYADIADELDCAHLEFFMQGVGGVSGMMLEDGLHPSRAGHERIARNVAPALIEVLAELTR